MKQTIIAFAATTTLDNRGITTRVIKGFTPTPHVSIYDMRREEENGKKGDGVKLQPINLILTDDIPPVFAKPENYPFVIRFEPKDLGKTQGAATAYTVAAGDLEIGKLDISKVQTAPAKT